MENNKLIDTVVPWTPFPNVSQSTQSHESSDGSTGTEHQAGSLHR
jgi:hypothetical protein